MNQYFPISNNLDRFCGHQGWVRNNTPDDHSRPRAVRGRKPSCRLWRGVGVWGRGERPPRSAVDTQMAGRRSGVVQWQAGGPCRVFDCKPPRAPGADSGPPWMPRVKGRVRENLSPRETNFPGNPLTRGKAAGFRRRKLQFRTISTQSTVSPP